MVTVRLPGLALILSTIPQKLPIHSFWRAASCKQTRGLLHFLRVPADAIGHRQKVDLLSLKWTVHEWQVSYETVISQVTFLIVYFYLVFFFHSNVFGSSPILAVKVVVAWASTRGWGYSSGSRSPLVSPSYNQYPILYILFCLFNRVSLLEQSPGECLFFKSWTCVHWRHFTSFFFFSNGGINLELKKPLVSVQLFSLDPSVSSTNPSPQKLRLPLASIIDVHTINKHHFLNMTALERNELPDEHHRGFLLCMECFGLIPGDWSLNIHNTFSFLAVCVFEGYSSYDDFSFSDGPKMKWQS